MPSQLQAKYPLSPRKFWKKLLPKVYPWVLIILVVVIGGAALSTLARTPQESSDILTVASFFTVGGIVLALLILIPYVFYIRAYIRRYYYDANDNFITIKKGVFAPAEIHVQYSKIQDVYVDQDVLDRFMGLYDVHLASATGTSSAEAHIDGVEQAAAEGLKNMLLGKIQGAANVPTSAIPASMPVSGAIKFPEEISSKTYPISGGWFGMQVIACLIPAFIFAVFAIILVYAPGKHSSTSIAQDAGWITNAASVWHLGFWVFGISYIFSYVYLLIWWKQYYFEFLPEYIMARSGLVSTAEVHVPYRTTQDVIVRQSALEKLFGIGRVTVQNVQGGVSIPGQPMERANHLADILKKTVLSKDPSQTGL